MKKVVVACFVLLLLGGTGYVVWRHTRSQATSSTAVHQRTQAPRQPAFDKTQYSLDDPASLWVVVNKLRPLNPKTYVPTDLVVPSVPLRVPGNESMQLRAPAAKALETMFADAKNQGISLMLSSSYRSYAYQVSLYGSYVNSSGQKDADTYSARPGYSEHQSGLAADVEPLDQQCDVSQCFADLPAGKWVAANAYKYGFLLRYPADKVAVTGYEYEPWHLRYVGTDLAGELQRTHTETLEEFFGLPPAPDYAK